MYFYTKIELELCEARRPQNPAQNSFFELAGLLGVGAKKNEKYNRGISRAIPSRILLENEGRAQSPKTAKIGPQVYENY